MRFRRTTIGLCGSLALLVAGCSGQAAAAPTTVTVSVPTTVVSRSTVTVTSTVTYDPVAAASSSSAAAAASVAAAGGAEFQAQLAAAGLTSPSYDTAKGQCRYLDEGKDPFRGAGGIALDFGATLALGSADEIKGLQIAVATLCPQHQAGLDAAIQKRADGAAASSAAAAARDQVTYSITASESGTALITYSEDSNFNISQENGAALPWTKDLTIPAGDLRILSLSAQNSGGGDIACSISVGGQEVDTATSSGDYAIVTCSHNG